MKIAVTGSHGLIARALIPRLEQSGHTVVRLVREGSAAPGGGQVGWDPAAGRLDRSALAGIGAVVHLAGAGIGDRRWSASRKALIVDSRVDGTRLLADALATLDGPRPTLLAASAIGIYGDRGEEELSERSPAGTGFLADVCCRWEEATAAAAAAGCRVVNLRSGVVLARKGGLLGRTLPLFRLGLGGRLGSGRQYLSWITLADEVAALNHLLAHDDISGPVNLTAPEPVTNAEFTRALGRALHRPAVLAVPGVALRTVLGREMADEMVLAGQRVRPGVLGATGFQFAHPSIDEALAAVLA